MVWSRKIFLSFLLINLVRVPLYLRGAFVFVYFLFFLFLFFFQILRNYLQIPLSLWSWKLINGLNHAWFRFDASVCFLLSSWCVSAPHAWQLCKIRIRIALGNHLMQTFVFNIIVGPIVFSTSCLLVYDFTITPDHFPCLLKEGEQNRQIEKWSIRNYIRSYWDNKIVTPCKTYKKQSPKPKKKYFKIWNKQIILQDQRSTMLFVSIKRSYALFSPRDQGVTELHVGNQLSDIHLFISLTFC